MSYYLGLDSSTQSLSALVIEPESGHVLLDESVNFGESLPQYKSPNGFLENPDPKVKHSDPLMWVDALDLLLSRLKDIGFDFSKVAGVSGAGQQHGSVYLRKPISEAPTFVPDKPLAEQVKPLLSRKTSPIWMDSSTSKECEEIAASVGGHDAVVRITGSRVIERFTGPQIRKFYKEDREAYDETAEIQLVSSFMTSVLSGTSAAIDLGDGAGMNLLDLATGEFHPKMLLATAPHLGRKLRRPVPSDTQVGTIAPYFVKKFGFAEQTPVFAFTGDNPSSLIGMGASQPGTLVVSLGTSDTVFAAMSEPRTDPRGFGHVFGNPAGGFMSLICFTNGSLAREKIREQNKMGWDDFSRAIIEHTKPGNDNNLLLPFFTAETTPRLAKPEVHYFGSDDFITERDKNALARAVVEAQALNMQRHCDFIGEKPVRLLVTGGAAKNAGILRVLADVFQAEIRRLKVGNSSALGGALRAAQAGGKLQWSALYEKFCAPEGDPVKPNPDAKPAYAELKKRFDQEIESLST